MATYYQKLTRIFWVSENYLFHAYAWYKYYTLTETHNKALTAEERADMASNVLLAAMSIPKLNEGKAGPDKLFDADDIASAKNQRMATLLGFHSNPTRAGLVEELMSKKLLEMVDPSVKALYEQLELKFHPLDMVTTVQPTLELLGGHKSLNIYVSPITRLLILRSLRQLATVYHSVRIGHFKELVANLNLSDNEI